MFGFLKRNSELEIFQRQYKELLAKAHRLSHSNRAESDQLLVKAEALAQKIAAIKKG